MRKLLIGLAALVLVSSCGVSDPELYYWGSRSNKTTEYENYSYKSYKKQTPEATCDLIVAYEKIVNNPGGERLVPPPGICAEYGYLLLKAETAVAFTNSATSYQRRIFGDGDYAVLFVEKGKKLLQRELELYPESAKFIKPLLDRLAR